MEKYVFSRVFLVFFLLLVMFGLLGLGNNVKSPLNKNNFFRFATLWQAPEGTNLEETPVENQQQALQSEKPVLSALKVALCLKDAGAKIYGIYWSEHTAKQREILGEYFKYLTYVECQTGNEILPECEGVKVSEYPLWVINGKKLKGEQTLEQLATAAGC